MKSVLIVWLLFGLTTTSLAQSNVYELVSCPGRSASVADLQKQLRRVRTDADALQTITRWVRVQRLSNCRILLLRNEVCYWFDSRSSTSRRPFVEATASALVSKGLSSGSVSLADFVRDTLVVVDTLWMDAGRQRRHTFSVVLDGQVYRLPTDPGSGYVYLTSRQFPSASGRYSTITIMDDTSHEPVGSSAVRLYCLNDEQRQTLRDAMRRGTRVVPCLQLLPLVADFVLANWGGLSGPDDDDFVTAQRQALKRFAIAAGITCP
ncbi:hypothetical protein GGR92_000482 [Spirosoma lacussanchae]|uniref:hypothetical protein n=1 Tax=Spirosoma lacussanchae TaxID=1884249 RepID=UPI001108C987|nr:hypothetical protein [Spirosoma lacussanchae]